MGQGRGSGDLDSNLNVTTVERVRKEEAVVEMHNYPEGETEAWKDVVTNLEWHNQFLVQQGLPVRRSFHLYFLHLPLAVHPWEETLLIQ